MQFTFFSFLFFLIHFGCLLHFCRHTAQFDMYERREIPINEIFSTRMLFNFSTFFFDSLAKQFTFLLWITKSTIFYIFFKKIFVYTKNTLFDLSSTVKFFHFVFFLRISYFSIATNKLFYCHQNLNYSRCRAHEKYSNIDPLRLTTQLKLTL